MKPIIFAAKVDLKASGSGQRFEIFAYAGGKLTVTGFPVPVVLDLKTLKERPGFSVIVDHQATTDHTLGQVQRMTNDGRGVVLAGAVTGAHQPVVKNVLLQAAKGHQWEASVGAAFDVSEAQFVAAGQELTVNGQTLPGPFILAINALIRETSILPMGADPHTSVNLAAMAALTLKGTAMQSFEEWAASLGIDPGTMSEGLKSILQAEYDEMVAQQNAAGDATALAAGTAAAPAADPTKTAEAAAALNLKAAAGAVPAGTTAAMSDPVQQMREASAAESARIHDIQTRCAGNQTIIQAALKQGWSPDYAELLMRRQDERSRAPAGHSKSHDASCTLQALQGAMIIRAGGRLDHPSYNGVHALAMNVPGWLRASLNDADRNKAMEAAWQYRDRSLLEIAQEACRLDGRELPAGRQEMLQAAFSGGSLASIFTTNVNTQILAAYEDFDDSTQEWTQEDETANFQEAERPLLGKGSGMKKLERTGTADHMNRSATAEKLRVARYAEQFVIDEQDMIDDTFGALADTPKEMGLAAAQLRPDLVYAVLAANPTLLATTRALFNVTDNNLTGSAALATDKLSAAIARIRLMAQNGRSLNLQPTHILVPPSLEDLTFSLTSSEFIVLGGTAGSVTEKGNKNPHARRGIKMVSDARLENGVTNPLTGISYTGSASTWFLACALAHTIRVAYLRGTGRVPQVRKFVLDKGQWGMGWDCNMDIGAAPMDFRGLQMQQSAAL